LVEDNNLKISETQFKIAIVSSLPPSWDTFTRPYISVSKGDNLDPKLQATSQELIGVLKEESVRRLRRAEKHDKKDIVCQASTSKPLESRLRDADCCGQCGGHNHKTVDCRFLGQNKCGTCGRFGHKTEDCYSKKAKEKKRKNEGDKKVKGL